MSPVESTVTGRHDVAGVFDVSSFRPAWFEREHHGLGVPYPPVAERFERLAETLEICAQMWDPDDNGPYEGKHYQLAETLCSPQPLHRPDVLIGGGGERKTLRLVAQHADRCNLFGASPEDVAHTLDVNAILHPGGNAGRTTTMTPWWTTRRRVPRFGTAAPDDTPELCPLRTPVMDSGHVLGPLVAQPVTSSPRARSPGG